MKLKDCANIRTGLVLSRKQANEVTGTNSISYKQLNLKCIMENGEIDVSLLDNYQANIRLRLEYLTHIDDVIIRLSHPYTAVIIGEQTEGIVISSHFVVIRTNKNQLIPQYLFWLLNRDSIKKSILQNNSGSILGTIKSSFFSELNIKRISLDKQKQIALINELSKKEIALLYQLVEQKRILTKQLTNQIYKNLKRGNL
jgi:restriction endonuclease S subunit